MTGRPSAAARSSDLRYIARAGLELQRGGDAVEGLQPQGRNVLRVAVQVDEPRGHHSPADIEGPGRARRRPADGDDRAVGHGDVHDVVQTRSPGRSPGHRSAADRSRQPPSAVASPCEPSSPAGPFGRLLVGIEPVSGTTLLSHGQTPYWDTRAYVRPQDPDIAASTLLSEARPRADRRPADQPARQLGAARRRPGRRPGHRGPALGAAEQRPARPGRRSRWGSGNCTP